MKAAEQIYELLVPIVEGMNRQITIDSVTVNASSYTINTCHTLWATKGYTVEIGGTDYVITDILPDQWIEVTGADPIVAATFFLYPFYFVHGKLRPVNTEISREENAFDKYPMLWLHDITDETFDRDPQNRLGRKADCNFYALADGNQEGLPKIVDHDRYAIRPMRNLLNAFIDALIASQLTLLDKGTDASYYQHQMRDDALFGKYFNGNNNSQNDGKFFNDDLSGTHLKINIPFKKSACADSPDTCPPMPAFGGVDIYEDGVFEQHVAANGRFDYTSGGGGGTVNVHNSDNTYDEDVACGGSLLLVDQTVDVYYDGVLVDTVTYPAMTEPQIDIEWQ